MSKPIKYTSVQLSELLEWVQKKLADKYKFALEGIQKRFIALFSIFKLVLNCCLELSSQFQRSSSDSTNARPLIDNIIHIINDIILEYPLVLDCEYCDSFMSSIQERLELIFTNSHPLTHIVSNDSKVNSNIETQTKTIVMALNKAHDCVFEIQNRLDLALPLLKKIEQFVKLFKEPTKFLLGEIKALKDLERFKKEYSALRSSYAEYLQNSAASPIALRIAENLKAFNDAQNELEYALEHVVKMSNIAKHKGKKLLREEGREDYRDLLSYVNLLVKPDFQSSVLPELRNTDDLVMAIMHLQSQRAILHELKKQHPFKAELESLRLVTGEELKAIIERWKRTHACVQELDSSEEYKDALQQFLGNPEHPVQELRKLHEKMRYAKKAIATYFKVNNWFSKFRYKVAKYCLEEFHERVELLWPEQV